ncbi:50S ribosomal protein L27 [Candidatus Azambacteria bacterium]|nr:50S ribosomal protein L27 [Candidatus Azambacteria bacterium]MBI2587709.1 50S ribosomal protein L27 [Candidatus Azambacteria bacterium]
MAHTKAAGSTKLGRESESKRLGIKKTHGEWVGSGMVLVRQRGTKYLPGKNVRQGGDDTLYAARAGVVAFAAKRKRRFDGRRRGATVVNVIPQSAEAVLPRQG